MEAPFIFQALTWHIDDSGNDDTIVMYAFGKRKDGGKSVALRIVGYQPSFHISVDENTASNTHYSQLFDLLQKRLWKHKDHIVADQNTVRSKSLWGFSTEPTPFFKFSFKSQKVYSQIKWLFTCIHRDALSVDAAKDVYTSYQQYLILNDDSDEIRSQRDKWHARRECTQAFIEDQAAKSAISKETLRWIVDLGDAQMPFEFVTVKLFNIVDHYLQFFHINNLNPAGWISVDSACAVDEKQKVTRCDLELKVSQEMIQKFSCDDISSNIREMSFDIECNFGESFASGKNPTDSVFQIGATCKTYNSPEVRRYLFHFRTPANMRGDESGLCGPIDDTTVINCETEVELLMQFHKFFVEEDPDVIYGYNSDCFDWSYLMDRAEMLGCIQEFQTLSRIKSYPCVAKDGEFSSSGQGDKQYRRVNVPGRLIVDVMGWLQANVNKSAYDTWGLGVVAKKEIGETKFEMPINDLKMAWQTGNEDKLTEVGKYCSQDCMLPQKIVNKMDVVTQLFEMANITLTPIFYLLTRGQQIKVYSLICYRCLTLGYMVPVMDDRGNKKFKGATVVPPERGLHEDPVVTLDFASLYPSIFIAYQICYSTLVRDQELLKELVRLAGPQNALEVTYQDVTYVVVQWTEDVFVEYTRCHGRRQFYTIDDAREVTGATTAMIQNTRNSTMPYWRMEKHRYTHAYAQQQKCVLPTFLTDILGQRGAVKKMMAQIEASKDADDRLRYRVLNGRQLALKVTANSVYGFPGAFILNEIALGSSVTAFGRRMNKQTVDFCNNELENIGRTTVWTALDCCTYLNEKLKCVVDYTLTEIPPGWMKMFPSARPNRPWIEGICSFQVIGGDTDSVFVKFKGATIAQAISVGYKAADLLTKRFNRPPIRMEYEKVHKPFLVHLKKNNAGLKYTVNDQDYVFSSTGLPLAKRSSCTFLKRAYLDVLLTILSCTKTEAGAIKRITSTDPSADALARLEYHLDVLQKGNVPFEQLFLTKALMKSYAGRVLCKSCPPDRPVENCLECNGRGKVISLPHVSLADRMQRRDPGSEPSVGERFSYLIIRDEFRDAAISSNSETPEYARLQNLEPDYQYYLNNQLRKPMTDLFSLTTKKTEAERTLNKFEELICNDITQKRKLLATSNGNLLNTLSMGSQFRREAPRPSKRKLVDVDDNNKLTSFFDREPKRKNLESSNDMQGSSSDMQGSSSDNTQGSSSASGHKEQTKLSSFFKRQ